MDMPADPRVPADSFRRLTFYSVLGGLCPLIPVPFVDDWALEQVQRRMFSEVSRREGLELSDREVRILAGGEDTERRGCLGTAVWLLRETAGAILGKLFRTVLYFLTIRRSVRRAAETLHLGYLVAHAARLGALSRDDRSEDRARIVRAAALEIQKEMDSRPIHRTLTRDFRQSLSLLLQVAALFGRFIPRRKSRRAPAAETLAGQGEAFKQAEGLLGGFTDRLAADLWGNRAYFAELERSLESHLEGKLPA
jgi:hypothetical protein